MDQVLRGLGDPTCNEHRNITKAELKQVYKQLEQRADIDQAGDLVISPVLTKLSVSASGPSSCFSSKVLPVVPVVTPNLRKEMAERGICEKCGQMLGHVSRFKEECQTCGTKILATYSRPAAKAKLHEESTYTLKAKVKAKVGAPSRDLGNLGSRANRKFPIIGRGRRKKGHLPPVQGAICEEQHEGGGNGRKRKKRRRKEPAPT
jgi:hypothetical protein